MDSIPNNVVNKKLYLDVKKLADETYKRDGLYKSAFIVKTYKAKGGKYKGNKTDNTTKWFKQKWIDMNKYLDGKIVECGRNKDSMRKFPACRPLYKEGENILTANEVIKKYGKDKIRKVINKKIKNPNFRINWNNL